MGVAFGLLVFFWLTRDLSVLAVLLLCLGTFVLIAGLGAWEGGRRVTPYTPTEQAQLRADERDSRSVEIRILVGIILVIMVLSLARGVWHLWH